MGSHGDSAEAGHEHQARLPAQKRNGGRARGGRVTALFLAFSLLGPFARATGLESPKSPRPAKTRETNSFPDLNEVFQGRAFKSKFDRDVFFLRRIRENYSAYWAPLLGANVVVNDYVLAPEKLLRFVEELGTATADTDDFIAATNLAAITSNPAFYANTNAYRPRVLRAAAAALIKIGPKGRRALAGSFSENHYRTDPVSLEVLADAIGKSGVSDSHLTAALAATAFTYTATNGGYYPRCTRRAVQSLLCLPSGEEVVKAHLDVKEVLDNPGRFQDVVDGIAAAHATGLAAELGRIADAVAAKLKSLSGPAYAGPYRSDLAELQVRLQRTIGQLRKVEPGRKR